jgi:hypothetical protein
MEGETCETLSIRLNVELKELYIQSINALCVDRAELVLSTGETVEVCSGGCTIEIVNPPTFAPDRSVDDPPFGIPILTLGLIAGACTIGLFAVVIFGVKLIIWGGGEIDKKGGDDDDKFDGTTVELEPLPDRSRSVRLPKMNEALMSQNGGRAFSQNDASLKRNYSARGGKSRSSAEMEKGFENPAATEPESTIVKRVSKPISLTASENEQANLEDYLTSLNV